MLRNMLIDAQIWAQIEADLDAWNDAWGAREAWEKETRWILTATLCTSRGGPFSTPSGNMTHAIAPW